MRCKNCGWPNKPNERECVKCHSPLVNDEEDVSASYSGSANGNESYSQTVREEDVFGQNVGANFQNSAKESQVCPKCGYPLRLGAEKCPNCNFSIKGVDTSGYTNHQERNFDSRSSDSSRRPTRMETNPSNSNGAHYRGTINPYMMNLEMDPTFALKPVKRMNERHEFEELEFEGKEVVLSRNNTEANNPSITSRQQAVITRVDGHWFIEDKSEQKTTFVQAAQKIELHDGDLILLGNRLFEFHT